MGRYVLQRLLSAVPVLLGVTVLAFFMIELVPGDPLTALFVDTGVPEAKLESMKEQLGLNDPLPVRYWRFLTNAARGDLGRAIHGNRKVTQMILQQLPATAQLAVASMALAMLMGIVLGVAAAIWANSPADTISMLLALVGVSLPTFWSGIMVILVFAVILDWLPATGTGSWRNLIMPAAVLGMTQAGFIARLTRSSMLEVLGQDYIVVARSKGLKERSVIAGHALKNALIPVVTVGGLQLGTLLNGAAIIELVFARQGLGNLAIYAIVNKDYPVIQGVVLFSAAIYTLVNVLVDILYGLLDPRIRYSNN
jgi:peptide/nickel transport system permease protein